MMYYTKMMQNPTAAQNGKINFKEIDRGRLVEFVTLKQKMVSDKNYAQNNWNNCNAKGDGCDQQ